MIMEMKYCELFKECESVYLNITEKMAEHVEAARVIQSCSINSEQVKSSHLE